MREEELLSFFERLLLGKQTNVNITGRIPIFLLPTAISQSCVSLTGISSQWSIWSVSHSEQFVFSGSQ